MEEMEEEERRTEEILDELFPSYNIFNIEPEEEEDEE